MSECVRKRGKEAGRERERETERKLTSSGSLPECLPNLDRARVRPRVRTQSRCPTWEATTLAIACGLPRSTLAKSWSQEPEAGIELQYFLWV